MSVKKKMNWVLIVWLAGLAGFFTVLFFNFYKNTWRAANHSAAASLAAALEDKGVLMDVCCDFPAGQWRPLTEKEYDEAIERLAKAKASLDRKDWRPGKVYDDVWGRRFRVFLKRADNSREKTQIIVWSLGADGKERTADDLVVHSDRSIPSDGVCFIP